MIELLDVDEETARLRDERPSDDDTSIQQLLAGDDRVFMEATVAPNNASEPRLLVVSGLAEGDIEVATYAEGGLHGSFSLLADGTRLVLSNPSVPELRVLDATDLDALTLEHKGELSSFIRQITLDGDRALCSLGDHGLEVVDLGP